MGPIENRKPNVTPRSGLSFTTARGRLQVSAPGIIPRSDRARIAVLPQEKLQLVRWNLERGEQPANHVADAIGREVALDIEIGVDLKGFPK